MSAGTLNLTIEQGSTWEYALKWCEYDENNPPNYEGDPIDLTSYTARAQIRKRKSSDTVQIEMTTENGRIVLGGVEGTITLYLTAEDTAGLNFNTGKWDLELVYLDGETEVVRRLVEGDVTLSKEVTK